MIAYLEPAQFLGTLIMGVGLGIMLTRTYDAVRDRLTQRRLGRIRRNVAAYAAGWPPPTTFWGRALDCDDTKAPTKTSGPEAAPANRDPQEPGPTPAPSGVAVQSTADAGEGVPPARSLLHGAAADYDWQVDFTAPDRRPA